MSRRVVAFAGLVILLAGGGFALTQTKKEAPPVPKEVSPVEATLQQYVAAYNKGDLATVLSFWAEDGELIQDDGNVVKGRKAIGELLKEVCKPEGGNTMKASLKGVKLLGTTVALIDGRVEITSPDGKDAIDFEGAMVQNPETKIWQFSRVRDLGNEEPGDYAKAYQQLKQLEWLIGNWTATDGDQTLTLNAKWMKNRAYIVVEQTIKTKGEEVLGITMFIGHDVDSDIIHSWVFDTQGGRGEADWTRDGNSWNVEASGLTADGLQASSKPTWKFIDDNTFEWKSVNRQLDGQPRADIQLTYRKVPATK